MYLTKDPEYGAARQVKRRKSTEKIQGCRQKERVARTKEDVGIG